MSVSVTQEKQTDFKTPDPKAFKGEADDLDRFLQQLENKFSMEPRRFESDLNKIRFTGQLLEGKAAKWYKSCDGCVPRARSLRDTLAGFAESRSLERSGFVSRRRTRARGTKRL